MVRNSTLAGHAPRNGSGLIVGDDDISFGGSGRRATPLSPCVETGGFASSPFDDFALNYV
jgi:hypothetical protein